MRISRNLLQNPKEGHQRALKDLGDTENQSTRGKMLMNNIKQRQMQ